MEAFEQTKKATVEGLNVLKEKVQSQKKEK
jgi:ribosomal protein L24